MDEDLPPLPVSAPKVEWDGRVSMPARWVESGEFGTIRIPATDYGRWEKQQAVDGHWYKFNGFFFEWAGNGQPAIIYADGSRGVSNVRGWRPGSPPLRVIHDDYGNVYEYDPGHRAYVYRRNRSAYQPPREHRPTVWGSLAWSVWWSWYPSIFIGWGLTALLVGTGGANAGDTSIPAIVLVVGAFWGVAHWLRWLRRSPK
jgi:hypothetical protein